MFHSKWFITIFLFLVLLSILVSWKIYRLQQPFTPEDLPEWTVIESTPEKWNLQAVHEKERTTTAWYSGKENQQCDTLLLVGGVKEGENLLKGGGKWSKTGNTIVLKQPAHSFLLRHPWKEWTILDWWQAPENIREEYRHTLGALMALLDYVHFESNNDPRFTDKVVMAGGSLGSSYPAIIASFFPNKVAGLMVVYGFTNYQYVSRLELNRQGLIHLGIKLPITGFEATSKAYFVKIISSVFSIILGNILKYGEIELYLPDINETPIYFINGKDDPLAPPEAYLPMWENANEPKSEVWIEGKHINPNKSEELLKVSKLMHDWAFSKNLRNCYKHKIN